MEAIKPIHTTAINMCESVESQNKDGTFQYRLAPIECVAQVKYCCAGRIPFGPIRPFIWKASEKNAEK